ncbi:hypothetical protein PFFVO_05915, partial [Plasmodium falciparum Vietnam Oak-Knoll (FVO)]
MRYISNENNTDDERKKKIFNSINDMLIYEFKNVKKNEEMCYSFSCTHNFDIYINHSWKMYLYFFFYDFFCIAFNQLFYILYENSNKNLRYYSISIISNIINDNYLYLKSKQTQHILLSCLTDNYLKVREYTLYIFYNFCKHFFDIENLIIYQKEITTLFDDELKNKKYVCHQKNDELCNRLKETSQEKNNNKKNCTLNNNNNNNNNNQEEFNEYNNEQIHDKPYYAVNQQNRDHKNILDLNEYMTNNIVESIRRCSKDIKISVRIISVKILKYIIYFNIYIKRYNGSIYKKNIQNYDNPMKDNHSNCADNNNNNKYNNNKYNNNKYNNNCDVEHVHNNYYEQKYLKNEQNTSCPNSQQTNHENITQNCNAENISILNDLIERYVSTYDNDNMKNTVMEIFIEIFFMNIFKTIKMKNIYSHFKNENIQIHSSNNKQIVHTENYVYYESFTKDIESDYSQSLQKEEEEGEEAYEQQEQRSDNKYIKIEKDIYTLFIHLLYVMKNKHNINIVNKMLSYLDKNIKKYQELFVVIDKILEDKNLTQADYNNNNNNKTQRKGKQIDNYKYAKCTDTNFYNNSIYDYNYNVDNEINTEMETQSERQEEDDENEDVEEEENNNVKQNDNKKKKKKKKGKNNNIKKKFDKQKKNQNICNTGDYENNNYIAYNNHMLNIKNNVYNIYINNSYKHLDILNKKNITYILEVWIYNLICLFIKTRRNSLLENETRKIMNILNIIIEIIPQLFIKYVNFFYPYIYNNDVSKDVCELLSSIFPYCKLDLQLKLQFKKVTFNNSLLYHHNIFISRSYIQLLCTLHTYIFCNFVYFKTYIEECFIKLYKYKLCFLINNTVVQLNNFVREFYLMKAEQKEEIKNNLISLYNKHVQNVNQNNLRNDTTMNDEEKGKESNNNLEYKKNECNENKNESNKYIDKNLNNLSNPEHFFIYNIIDITYEEFIYHLDLYKKHIFDIFSITHNDIININKYAWLISIMCEFINMNKIIINDLYNINETIHIQVQNEHKEKETTNKQNIKKVTKNDKNDKDNININNNNNINSNSYSYSCGYGEPILSEKFNIRCPNNNMKYIKLSDIVKNVQVYINAILYFEFIYNKQNDYIKRWNIVKLKNEIISEIIQKKININKIEKCNDIFDYKFYNVSLILLNILIDLFYISNDIKCKCFFLHCLCKILSNYHNSHFINDLKLRNVFFYCIDAFSNAALQKSFLYSLLQLIKTYEQFLRNKNNIHIAQNRKNKTNENNYSTYKKMTQLVPNEKQQLNKKKIKINNNKNKYFSSDERTTCDEKEYSSFPISCINPQSYSSASPNLCESNDNETASHSGKNNTKK